MAIGRYRSLVERILNNSVISDSNFMQHADGSCSACWEWVGKRVRSARQLGGYPALTERYKSGKRKGKVHNVKVHRVVGSVFCGLRRMQRRYVARHLCCNINCVNPAHIHAGSQWRNVQDTVQAGRHGNQHRSPVKDLRGEFHVELQEKEESEDCALYDLHFPSLEGEYEGALTGFGSSQDAEDLMEA